MRNLKTLAALGLLTASGAANAGVASTWTLASDYDYRGNSQTAKDFAVQASIDYAGDAGWYVGGWVSNLDWGGADVDYELDLYTGIARTYESGLGWDAGLLHYTYPDEPDFNYLEVYGAISYDAFKAKVSYSPAFGGDAAEALSTALTGNDDVSAWYVEGSAAIPLPANFTVLLHAGLSTGDYWDNDFGDDQIDYSVGVGYSAGGFSLALKYIDTEGDVEVTADEFNNEGRVNFTIATTFPRGD